MKVNTTISLSLLTYSEVAVVTSRGISHVFSSSRDAASTSTSGFYPEGGAGG